MPPKAGSDSSSRRFICQNALPPSEMLFILYALSGIVKLEMPSWPSAA